MPTNGNTYDLTPPRPPNLADFNGASKVDDGNEPPDPTTMPNSAEYNTMQKVLVAMGAVLPTAEVAVSAGASPAIASVLSPCSAVSGVPTSFVLTRVAAGDYWVEFNISSTQLPALVSRPKVFINDVPGGGSETGGALYGTGPVNGWPAARVRTFNNGTLQDINFTIQFR